MTPVDADPFVLLEIRRLIAQDIRQASSDEDLRRRLAGTGPTSSGTDLLASERAAHGRGPSTEALDRAVQAGRLC